MKSKPFIINGLAIFSKKKKKTFENFNCHILAVSRRRLWRSIDRRKLSDLKFVYFFAQPKTMIAGRMV